MKSEFAENPAYIRFERAIHALHELIAEGKGDDEAADVLRDDMMADYRQLSAREEVRLNGLSEDLYSLTGDSAPPSSVQRPGDPETVREILRAREHGDWAALLPLLRTLAQRFDGSTLAFQRYQAYAHLGHPEAAYLFLRRSVRLDPTNVRKRHLLLDFSAKAGRTAEAVAEAETLLTTTETPAPLIVPAAHIRFESLRNTSLEIAEPILRRIEALLRGVIADPNALLKSPTSVAILAETTLAYCRERLGDLEGAMAAFDKALSLDPSSDALRVARGLVLARYSMDRAAAEFYEAVKLGSRLIHPYLFLAPYELGRGRWVEASAFAKTLRARTQDPAIEAEALQWQAIAMFELGSPWPMVERLFGEAYELDPVNSRIAENFALCQAARQIGDHKSVQWSRRGPGDFPEPPRFCRSLW